MIRAFLAVEIARPVVEAISLAARELAPRLSDLRWVPPENLHVTLKFLGPVEEQKLESIASALPRALSPFSRFTINAKGLGVFPDIRRPRVLWVGLEGGPLAALSSALDDGLEPLGFERETRPFTPHLTIARWRQPGRAPSALPGLLERWHGHEFGSSEVSEVVLFQSVLHRQGAVYHRLKAFRLGGP